jgi:hypothetical protein
MMPQKCEKLGGDGYYCYQNPMLQKNHKQCKFQGDIILKDTLEGIVWYFVCKADKGKNT